MFTTVLRLLGTVVSGRMLDELGVHVVPVDGFCIFFVILTSPSSCTVSMWFPVGPEVVPPFLEITLVVAAGGGVL